MMAMALTLRRPLGFSESFVEVEYAHNVEHVLIDAPTTVFNLGDAAINVGSTSLKPLHSSIYSNISIPSAATLLFITTHAGKSLAGPFPHASHIVRQWTHVYELLHLPHLKGTQLWRSTQERVGDVAFNLWYASAGTDCGIHNTHPFRELHTQLFGFGRMQKFHENNPDTLYQDVLMAPGYTHEPFYDEDCVYPWHRYYADTDCLWLAVEFYPTKI